MQEVLTKILDSVGWALWLEIKTEIPSCLYYFGPFLTEKEARIAQTGYIEDLQEEGAIDITVSLKRCQPSELTVFDEPTPDIFHLPNSRYRRQMSA